MRRALGFVIVVGGWLVTTGVQAGDVLYTARVTKPETMVRARPSAAPNVYATNRLPQGTVVEVIQNRDLPDGWLGIRPPAGSFSWINMLVLDPTSNATVWVVRAAPDDPVPVRYGSDLIHEEPTIDGAKLSRGAQVIAVGRPLVGPDGKWLPIESPPGEVRYILAADVTPATGSTAAPAAPASRYSDAPAMPPSSSPPAVPPAAGHPALLALAQQAENERRYTDAINLYDQLCREVKGTDPTLAKMCCNRIAYLNQFVAAGYYPGPQRLTPTPAAGGGAPAAPQVQPATYQRPAQASAYQSPYQPPTQPSVASNPAQTMTYSGYLRRAGRTIEGLQAFALQDSGGQLIAYITAQPGSNADLAAHAGTNVQVTGPTVYRAALVHNHMSATQVTPLP
jgi:hypothetical protein